MSFYNMLFGVNEMTPAILATIGLTVDDIPRFRNCYFDDDRIAVYTRTGGGNREDYEEENDALAANQYYISDEDDDFDCTYATFYFRFPDEYAEDLKAVAAARQDAKPSDQWQALFAKLSEQPK